MAFNATRVGETEGWGPPAELPRLLSIGEVLVEHPEMFIYTEMSRNKRRPGELPAVVLPKP
jgi:hypothetical protein